MNPNHHAGNRKNCPSYQEGSIVKRGEKVRNRSNREACCTFWLGKRVMNSTIWVSDWAI